MPIERNTIRQENWGGKKHILAEGDGKIDFGTFVYCKPVKRSSITILKAFNSRSVFDVIVDPNTLEVIEPNDKIIGYWYKSIFA
ncbi:MAG TPA: hypothetical protein VI819_03145 [Patescibacteria group bacterium]|nr:hypothetical protein [Patescibacteria group bacterium]